MIKLVALDLDDTLLTTKLEISPNTAQAIKQAIAKGVTVTLATGRMYRSALPFALDLGMEVPLITYHGALVKTSLTKEVIYHRTIPLELARLITQVTRNLGFHLNIYMNDQLHAEKANPHIAGYTNLARVPYNEVPDLLQALVYEPDKLMIIDAEQKLDELAITLQELVGNKLHITKSKPHFLEITHPQATKGQAITALVKHLGIERSQVMAVGDSYNDLDMLQYAGIGVAMGNARPAIQQQANYVTKSNDEDGVAEAFYKFVL
jgi:Cof subfamily protein (haloacid dehalogenase superfamily)